jgi:enoyl-CoA hydratase/carnithine racemase
MKSSYGPVGVEIRGALAVLRFNGIHGNAVNERLLDGLDQALAATTADGAVRGILLAAAGKLFCPGLDLQVLSGFDRVGMDAFMAKFSRVMLTLYTAPLPVAAAVHGHAIAGGCVLAMTTDWRVLRRDALIGLNEIRVGVPLPWGVVQILREAVPGPRVEEVCLLGRNYTNEEALATGLVHEIAGDGAVERQALARLEELAEKDARSFAITKGYLRRPAAERIRGFEASLRNEFLDCWFSGPTQRRILEIVAGLGKKA